MMIECGFSKGQQPDIPFLRCGFKHLKGQQPYNPFIGSGCAHCSTCGKQQGLTKHGYAKRWGIWIKGRAIFIIDTKREYYFACEECGTRQSRITKLRLREISSSIEAIQMYGFLLGIFPLIWLLGWIFY